MAHARNIHFIIIHHNQSIQKITTYTRNPWSFFPLGGSLAPFLQFLSIYLFCWHSFVLSGFIVFPPFSVLLPIVRSPGPIIQPTVSYTILSYLVFVTITQLTFPPRTWFVHWHCWNNNFKKGFLHSTLNPFSHATSKWIFSNLANDSLPIPFFIIFMLFYETLNTH